MTQLAIPSVEPFREQFAECRDSLPGAGQDWLIGLREASFERFARTGLPGRKIETWRYTGLGAIGKMAQEPAGAGTAIALADLEDHLIDAPEAPRLVFVDGCLQQELSTLDGLDAGIEVMGLADALERTPARVRDLLTRTFEAGSGADDQALVALNGALFTDGAVIHVSAGTLAQTPVHLIFVATKTSHAVHPRNLIIAEDRSRASIVESYIGRGEGWTNAVTQISVGRGAHIDHYRILDEAGGARHIGATEASLADNGGYRNFSLVTGGRLSRNEISVCLDGSGCHCELAGVTLAGEGQHCDILSRVDHRRPECASSQEYRSAIAARGRSVFQGKVIVQPHAQHTDARQNSKNLLLAKSAEAITKPELEIHADDVKCSHGATVGELDADMLFYLRSRGLDLDAARGLLIEGFVAELLDRAEYGPIRALLRATAERWRPQRSVANKAA